MTCVQCLQQVKGFAATNLSHNYSVWPVAKRGLEQISDADCRNAVLLSAGFKANKIGLSDADFCSVFYQDDTVPC